MKEKIRQQKNSKRNRFTNGFQISFLSFSTTSTRWHMNSLWIYFHFQKKKSTLIGRGREEPDNETEEDERWAQSCDWLIINRCTWMPVLSWDPTMKPPIIICSLIRYYSTSSGFFFLVNLGRVVIKLKRRPIKGKKVFCEPTSLWLKSFNNMFQENHCCSKIWPLCDGCCGCPGL